jgi:hypothetical protein
MQSFISWIGVVAVLIGSCSDSIAQGRPDPAAHKAALEKLKFLEGKWKGEATITTTEGETIKIVQTEDVQYKLEGTVMLIEGTGRDEKGKIVFNALAVVSFEPATKIYRIRAWNNGNSIETEFKVGKETFEWGFEMGPVKVVHKMNIDEKRRWSELSEAKTPDGKTVYSIRMLLSREPATH